MKVIEEALRLLPSANWWIKADGVDVISSLEESMRLEWNGDVDLGDGHTQALYEKYRGRLKSAEDLDLSLGNVHSVAECVPVLLEIQQAICDDLEFINKCKFCDFYSSTSVSFGDFYYNFILSMQVLYLPLQIIQKWLLAIIVYQKRSCVMLAGRLTNSHD